MQIAVLGTGRVGSTLARALAEAGHRVAVGSRDPGARRVEGLRVVGLVEAAAGAEVVVNATPGAESLRLLTSQPGGWLDGTILLDVSNADGGDGTLVYPNESLAERLQAAFPRTAVVKALNTLNRTVMVEPALLPAPTTVFLSGDDEGAKEVVASLLVDLGWPRERHLDLGPLTTARAVEHYIAMYHAIRDAVSTRDFNISVVWNPPNPVG